jgi:hypothetical protein
MMTMKTLTIVRIPVKEVMIAIFIKMVMTLR